MTNEFGVDVPDHTLLSRLGQGGMAAVYLAREDRLGRLVAVKVIHQHFERDATFRRRFEREARTAASLTHPHIVPLYQYGFTSDDRPYLTMAFAEDGSLRDRLRKHGCLPVDEALAITRQLASALLAAHSRNVVHRDLKPDNVLFQGDTALLTDFGIVKVLDAATSLTGTGTSPGSVHYFSPEQASEQPLDQRSDIYTLGVILFEMLTGRLPINGASVVQMLMRIVHQLPEALPEPLRGLQPLMDVLLAKDPASRLASCADLIAVLQAMERNWTRFGEVDRLTHGVALPNTGGAGLAAPTWLWQGDRSETVPSALPADVPPRPVAPSAPPGFVITHVGAVPRWPNLRDRLRDRLRAQWRLPLAMAATGVLFVGAAYVLREQGARRAGTDAAAGSARVAPAAVPLSLQEGPRGYLDEPIATVRAPLPPPRRAVRGRRGEAAHGVVQVDAPPHAVVRIEVEPADARILLPELDTGYVPDMQVPAGLLRVRVLHPAYREQSLALRVPENTKNTFKVVLHPLAGMPRLVARGAL